MVQRKTLDAAYSILSARETQIGDELYHHGILGQKWGVRRYQNEDGTRTPAGKKRYAENYSEEQRSRDRQIYSKGAERRINKAMLEGEGIQTARSREADRIARYREAATNVKRKPIKDAAGTIGAIGGALASKAVTRAINRGSWKTHRIFANVLHQGVNETFKGKLGEKNIKGDILYRIGHGGATISDAVIKTTDWLNTTQQGRVVRTALGSAIGATLVGSIPETASKTVMRAGGYKPEKRRY